MPEFGVALRLGFALVVISCGAERGSVRGPDSGSDGTIADDAGTKDDAAANDTAANDAAAGDTSADDAATGAGGIDAGPDTILAPVRVTRGDPASTFLTATFEARGWPAEDEGRLVMLRLGRPDRSPERLAAAETRVEGGAFRITVPMGSEQGLYQQKVALVDIDGDGACTQGIDRIYLDNSFIVSDLTFVLAGSVPDVGAGERRMALRPAPSESADAACAVMNLAWPDS